MISVAVDESNIPSAPELILHRKCSDRVETNFVRKLKSHRTIMFIKFAFSNFFPKYLAQSPVALAVFRKNVPY
jgi:hypothetical protein